MQRKPKTLMRTYDPALPGIRPRAGRGDLTFKQAWTLGASLFQSDLKRNEFEGKGLSLALAGDA